MEKSDNILIVESECEIIKPKFIKNKYNEDYSQEENDSKEENKEENIDNIDNIMSDLNKAFLTNFDDQDNNKKK